jgi:hypothetical protein
MRIIKTVQRYENLVWIISVQIVWRNYYKNITWRFKIFKKIIKKLIKKII